MHSLSSTRLCYSRIRTCNLMSWFVNVEVISADFMMGHFNPVPIRQGP